MSIKQLSFILLIKNLTNLEINSVSVNCIPALEISSTEYETTAFNCEQKYGNSGVFVHVIQNAQNEVRSFHVAVLQSFVLSFKSSIKSSVSRRCDLLKKNFQLIRRNIEMLGDLLSTIVFFSPDSSINIVS